MCVNCKGDGIGWRDVLRLGAAGLSATDQLASSRNPPTSASAPGRTFTTPTKG
jgi:hypothetical protein